ncbi:Chemotaxis protein histidine kinase (modular protein) [metagenome]
MSDNNYREMYVSESLEHVTIINQTLLKLAEKPNEKSYLDQIFRSAHTVKGMASTMGYSDTVELCKNIENIFDNLRNGIEKLTPHVTDILFTFVNLLQQMITDEKFKVDLEPYLKKLKNPGDSIQYLFAHKNTSSVSPTIRVKMTDLDTLVNSVGELMISKMRLKQTIDNKNYEESKQILNDIDHLITDLQHRSMQIRLVPVNQIFNRFSLTVRDISKRLGKEVNLEMSGSDIDLDRSILDSITEPLLHILRNCVDHGIESAEERKKQKKSEKGNISLIASRKGEHILITIKDDGKGIDEEKVREKAIEKKIITQDEASKLNHQETIQLIGSPGLSTSEEITDISGRGVGMDVVISQVEAVGGSVKIYSEKNAGTTIILSIPMNISIIKGLIIIVSNQQFVLPISNIVTTLKIKSNDVFSLHGNKVINFENHIIPLIELNKLLCIDKKESHENSVTIIIIENNEKKYGLIIDKFEQNQDVVIKKLDDNTYSDMFSNATILPDGKVSLVLEPSLLIH